MSSFYSSNPASTVVGSGNATESTIAQNAATQTDTSSGFYQGSPTQTTTNAYTADALSSKNAAAISAAAAAQSASQAAISAAASSVSIVGGGATTVSGTHPSFTVSSPLGLSNYTNDADFLNNTDTLQGGFF